MAGPRRFDTSTLMPAPVNSAGLGAAPGAHHAGARRPAPGHGSSTRCAFCAVELVAIHRTDRCWRARASRAGGRPAGELAGLAGFWRLAVGDRAIPRPCLVNAPKLRPPCRLRGGHRFFVRVGREAESELRYARIPRRAARRGCPVVVALWRTGRLTTGNVY